MVGVAYLCGLLTIVMIQVKVTPASVPPHANRIR